LPFRVEGKKSGGSNSKHSALGCWLHHRECKKKKINKSGTTSVDTIKPGHDAHAGASLLLRFAYIAVVPGPGARGGEWRMHAETTRTAATVNVLVPEHMINTT
jgi:hypothetical protein